jgi:hypothetical protein
LFGAAVPFSNSTVSGRERRSATAVDGESAAPRSRCAVACGRDELCEQAIVGFDGAERPGSREAGKRDLDVTTFPGVRRLGSK